MNRGGLRVVADDNDEVNEKQMTIMFPDGHLVCPTHRTALSRSGAISNLAVCVLACVQRQLLMHLGVSGVGANWRALYLL